MRWNACASTTAPCQSGMTAWPRQRYRRTRSPTAPHPAGGSSSRTRANTLHQNPARISSPKNDCTHSSTDSTAGTQELPEDRVEHAHRLAAEQLPGIDLVGVPDDPVTQQLHVDRVDLVDG